MLKRDYILRLIREFAEALELVMKKDVSKQRDEIRLMYDQYVGPYSLYHICTMDEVMDGFRPRNAPNAWRCWPSCITPKPV